jgi:hypothetical protein
MRSEICFSEERDPSIHWIWVWYSFGTEPENVFHNFSFLHVYCNFSAIFKGSSYLMLRTSLYWSYIKYTYHDLHNDFLSFSFKSIQVYIEGTKQENLGTTFLISIQDESYLVKITFNEFCISELFSDAAIWELCLTELKPNGIIMTAVSLYRCRAVPVKHHKRQRTLWC